MKCPHCLDNFFAGTPNPSLDLGLDAGWRLVLEGHRCPACQRLILLLKGHAVDAVSGEPVLKPIREVTRMLHPRAASRTVAPEVPEDLAEWFRQACVILNDSPMASAALARRCLQHVLRDKAGANEKTLAEEITKVLASKTLPSPLASTIDAIRNFGNFSAHPTHDIHTSEIIPVEPEEAEWTIEIVEGLFDFYYVEPERATARLDALNQKLVRAGKPPAK